MTFNTLEVAISDVSAKVESMVNEAYARGVLDGEKKAEEVWTFISNTVTPNTPERAWDKDTDNSIGYGSVWKKFDTYAEARAAFEAWKKRGQWEPMVGDVVRSKRIENCFGAIIDGKHSNGEVGVWWKFGEGANVPVDDLEPTGRHVDLSNILRVLEEAEHE